MPYISCPDGHTYSRYDDSPYVQNCIAAEDKYYQELQAKCDADPKCIERESNMVIMTLSMFAVLIFLITLLAVKFIKAWK